MADKGHGEQKPQIFRLVDRLLAQGEFRKAMKLLASVIEDSMPLFESEPWVMEERRLAWLYRIQLLRERGDVTEALAWACLEVELNPENVTAQALKERLKWQAGLQKRRQGPTTPIHAGRNGVSANTWDGVAGMRELKTMLERDVILPLLEPEIYARYRLNLPNGILLYGPPGCGKTFIARKLAAVLGFHFREVKPGDIASIYVHGTQGIIAQLFAEAKKSPPCLLFFDEIDAMVPKREGGGVGHHYASEVNEFLVQLNECHKHRVLVVGATNLPSRIDAAILRPGRLDKKFFVGPPDYPARLELIKLAMKDRPQKDFDFHRCATETEDYTCAEVDFLVNESARLALSQGRPILTGDFLHVAGNNPPVHTPEAVEKMREF